MACGTAGQFKMQNPSHYSSSSVSPESSVSQVAGCGSGLAAPPGVEDLLGAGFSLNDAKWMWEQYFALCKCIVAESVASECSNDSRLHEHELETDNSAVVHGQGGLSESSSSGSGVKLFSVEHLPRNLETVTSQIEKADAKPVVVKRSWQSRRRRVAPPEGAYQFDGECYPGAPGYEYAKLVKPESWQGVAAEIGPYPGLRSLLAVGPQHLLPWSELSAIRVRPRTRHLDLGSCVSGSTDSTFFSTVLRSVPLNELSKKWRKVIGERSRTYVPGVTAKSYGLGGERYCKYEP